jgi:hypothetical protein
MIKRDNIAGVKLDGIRELEKSLRLFRRRFGNKRLVVFKSDMKAAYRQMPLAFLWQIKQIATVDGQRHVDRCVCFGCRSSQYIFMAFMGLVVWIAIYVHQIEHLKDYVDDLYSFEVESNMLFYEPYNRSFPTKQTRLLLLWDELGIPHSLEKQEFGSVLSIIGFLVDPNAMTVTMSAESRADLVSVIRIFAVRGKRRTLKEFQRVAGHINWAFNVFPLLKPGLSAVYAKTAGKDHDLATIKVSAAVVFELDWVARRVESSTGVHFFKTVEWDPRNASSGAITILTDASLAGIAFYVPELKLGFQARLPAGASREHIFFFEAFAVCSAFHYFADMMDRKVDRLVVYSDNTNTVDIFDSLRAIPPYSRILISAITKVLDNHIDFRVLHIRGVDNSISDALSRYLNDLAISLCPGLVIREFEPPLDALGAIKK